MWSPIKVYANGGINSKQTLTFQFSSCTCKIAILEQERQLLLVSIRSLAEFNLAEQETFESDRAKLLGLLSDSNRLKQQIKEKSDQLKELASKTSLESTSKIVSAAAAEVEEQSERIAQAFLNREIDYLEFDASYVPKRKLAHSRRYKADRLKLETIET